MKALLGMVLVLLVAVASANAQKVDKTGERVYRSKCKSCHSGDGGGISERLAIKKKLDPKKLSLATMTEKSDDELVALTKEGHEKMPAFGEKLSEEKIRAVLEYCKTLKVVTGSNE